MKLYHQKLQVRQKHKELATPNSHRHDNLYIFKIYTVFLSFLGSLIIFIYAKLLTELPWRGKPEYHCFNCLSGPVFQKNCQQNERSKHRKSSNIWHKPSRRCLRGPLGISSSPGQTRLRTVRPQCGAGRAQMRRTQSPEWSQPSCLNPFPWLCPPSTQGSSPPVTSGIPG